MMTDAALWARLTAYGLDDPGARFPFCARLARENGWSRDFAIRAIEEYKRFVYLALVSPGDVTPSDLVDQVWHLHLTYTRSYWEKMCGEVLRRPLHHDPTKGAPEDSERYRVQYENTVMLYEREFGHLPPAEIWPDGERRFASAAYQLSVDRRRYWLIRKPRRAAALLAAAFASVPVLSEAIADTATHSGNEIGWLLPILGLLVLAAGFFLYKVLLNRKNGKSSKESSCGTDVISSFDVASGKNKVPADTISGDGPSSDGSSGCSGCGGCGG